MCLILPAAHHADRFAKASVMLRHVVRIGSTLAALVLASPASAGTYTWNSSPSNSQWSVPQNWTPNGIPGPSDVVQFTLISTSPSVNLGGARTVFSVQFGGLSPYSLNNGSLTLEAGGSIATNTSILTTSYSINTPITINSATVFALSNMSTLTVSQAITDNGNVTLRKSGLGTLALTGGSSNVDSLSAEQGTLDINSGSLTVRGLAPSFALSLSTTTTVRGGGKLIGNVGNKLRLGAASAAYLSIDGAGSELKTLDQLIVGQDGSAGLFVSNGGKISGVGSLIIGGAGGGNQITANINSQAIVQSATGALGAADGVTGGAIVSGLGTEWQTTDMNLGTLSEFGDGRGILQLSHSGRVTAAGATTFFGDESAIIVNQGVYSTARLATASGSFGYIDIDDGPFGAGLVINNPDVNTTATYVGIIADRPNGAGSVYKTGAGTQIFGSQVTYTNGTLIDGGVLKLGVADTLAATGPVEVDGGTLDLGGQAQHIGPFILSSGTLAGAAGSTLVASYVDTLSGAIAAPLITTAAVTKQGAGTTTATAPITANALVVIGGTFDAQGGVKANVNTAAGAQFKFRGTLEGILLGNTGSTTTLTGAAIVTGSTNVGGTLAVGASTLAFTDSGDPLVSSTTIAGGVITSPGVYRIGANLSGHGLVTSRISSLASIPPASIIALGGPLTLGTFAAADSLSGYTGSLTAGVQQLTLLSSDFTTLGNSITVAGGSINSINGVQVSAGKSLSGHGVVNGPLKNLGVVTGGSGANMLHFTGPVTGSGSFQANVQFEHTYSPGASAASVSFAGDPVFAATSRLDIELGGRTQGTQYDHLNVNGELSLAGALRVSLIDDFHPVAGDAFDILDWTTLTGAFASLELPELPGFLWDASQLYVTGTLSVVPRYEADFDSNGLVDAADLTILRSGFGGTSAGRATGDATGDGFVDGSDFLLWQRQLGSGAAATPISASIPEPASALLAVLALPLLRRRRS
jgi:fibronectin-binding autotransporter adhesin